MGKSLLPPSIPTLNLSLTFVDNASGIIFLVENNVTTRYSLEA